MDDEKQNPNPMPDLGSEEMKMPEQQFGPPVEPEEKSSVVPVVLSILIVLLLLILGGLYLWSTTMQTDAPTVTPAIERPTPEENNEPESNNAEADVETFQAVSTSDEIGAIEADLEATNLDELDAELNAIDAELEAALQ